MSKSTMSSKSSEEGGGRGGAEQKQSKFSNSLVNKNKFKGIRRRKWGKWVSEIRVPGTSSRLWLGSYSTAEGAAAAHDLASFYLRSSSSNSLNVECGDQGFNFPEMVRCRAETLSPRSVQKAASDAGMAVDAAHRVFVQQPELGIGDAGRDCGKTWCFGGGSSMEGSVNGGNGNGEDLNISVDDYLQQSPFKYNE